MIDLAFSTRLVGVRELKDNEDYLEYSPEVDSSSQLLSLKIHLKYGIETVF